jgi:hypothetical protein
MFFAIKYLADNLSNLKAQGINWKKFSRKGLSRKKFIELPEFRARNANFFFIFSFDKSGS